MPPLKKAAATLFHGTGGLPFDADVAVGKLRKADKKLARLIDKVGPFHLRIEQTQSPFSALSQSIVYQQLNGKAAATIFSRVQALFPEGHATPETLLATDEESLRGAGLSRGKLASMRDLAQKTMDGIVPSYQDLAGMGEEEIIERLTEVRGIGRWTVEMLLIFRLGRPDVLPAGDYGVRKGFAATFGWGELPTPAQLTEAGERWRPYRTVASWYFWRATEL